MSIRVQISSILIAACLACAVILAALAVVRAVTPPAPDLFRGLGIRVTWDPSISAIRAVLPDGIRVRFAPRHPFALVEGRRVRLSAPVVMTDNAPLVPLRFLAEQAGAIVRWDPLLRLAEVTTPPRRATGVPSIDPAPSTTAGVVLDGVFLPFEQSPLLVDGRLLVPLPRVRPGPLSLAAGAAYAVLVASLLLLSAGLHRSIMVVATAGIFATYLLRLVTLAVEPHAFQFGPGSRTGVTVAVLTDGLLLRAVAFMAIGTVAFWTGVRWTTLRRGGAGRSGGVSEGLWGHRRLLITTALAMAVVKALIFAVVDINVRTGSSWSFLTELLQTDMLGFIVMLLLLDGWGRLTWGQRAAMMIFFPLALVPGFLTGQRGVFISLGVWWLMAAVFLTEDPKVRLLLLGGLGALAIRVLPTLITVASVIRQVAYDLQGPFWVQVAEVYAQTRPATLADAFRELSSRMNGLDSLLAVMSHHAGLAAYLNVPALLRSTAGMLVPEWLWSPAVPTMGKVFAYIYQGIALDLRHEGAWSGFGLFYALWLGFGWLGLGALGAGVGWLLSRLGRWGTTGEALRPVALSTFVWMMFMSANLDRLLSSFVISGVIVALLFRGGSPRRAMQTRSREPEAGLVGPAEGSSRSYQPLVKG